jgi:hypothetical protein
LFLLFGFDFDSLSVMADGSDGRDETGEDGRRERSSDMWTPPVRTDEKRALILR